MPTNKTGRIRRVGTALVLSWGLSAQTAFDVESVKPLESGSRTAMQVGCANGRFVATTNLSSVLAWAYEMKPYQLKGLPEWDPKVFYDSSNLYRIEGTTSSAISLPHCRTMVQQLIADRFRMKSHRQQIEMPVYALVVAKSGVKMQRVQADSDTPGVNVKVNGNAMGSAMGAGRRPPGWSMAQLVEFLPIAQLDRPVIDKTGLDGVYRINLDFSIFFPQNPSYTAPPEAGPDIRTALTEQLGLRLQSTKAPIDVLVIDHIERPSAN